jgi:hypothetical protein
MISPAEIKFALRGILRILRFDASFVQYFDRSAAGALRSFWLAVPLLGLSLLRLDLLHDPQEPALTSRMWLTMIVTHVVNWVYFPLFLLWLGRYIERDARVVGCIAVYNWLGLLAILTSTPLLVLALFGFDGGFLQTLDIISLVISLICEGYVLAVCLQISGWFATALVALDVICGEMLFSFAHRLGTAPIF